MFEGWTEMSSKNWMKNSRLIKTEKKKLYSGN